MAETPEDIVRRIQQSGAQAPATRPPVLPTVPQIQSQRRPRLISDQARELPPDAVPTTYEKVTDTGPVADMEGIPPWMLADAEKARQEPKTVNLADLPESARGNYTDLQALFKGGVPAGTPAAANPTSAPVPQQVPASPQVTAPPFIPTAPAVEVAPAAPTETISDRSENPAEKKDPAQETFAAKHCTRCGWDPANPYPTTPSDDDRIVFISTLRSGRFIKTYDLFSGRMKVTFRTLTPREQLTCRQALMAEVPAQTLVEDAVRVELQLNLFAQLVAIQFVDGEVVEFPRGICPAISGSASTYHYPDQSDGVQAVRDLRNRCLDNLFQSAPLLQSVMVALEEFTFVVNALRGEMENPKVIWPLPVSVR